MNEAEEARLRQRAMVIIARRGWSRYTWRRVMKRLLECINR
jgi:hypothetical protein